MNHRQINIFWPVLCIVSAVITFLYSYTQVDLNLTLSGIGFLPQIQSAFQYIGYYERGLSAIFFLTVLSLLFFLYIQTLHLLKAGILKKDVLIKGLGVLVIIFVFSYPAFSYDIYNYMFTSKTVLLYHKNPYTTIPLLFSGFDPWLNFLRWTHLPSAYTPLWILLTLPSYILSFGQFLLNLWFMKLTLAFFYILSVYGLYRIFIYTDKANALYKTAVFAFNPLVLIESIISPHNDIVMVAFFIWSYLAFIRSNKLASVFLMSLSVGLKMMTIVLFPLYLFNMNKKLGLVMMFLALLIGFIYKEFLPWYFLWIMPFIALNSHVRYLVFMSTVLSLALTVRYGVFIYFGDYSTNMLKIRDWLSATVVLVGVIGLIIYQFLSNQPQKIISLKRPD